MIQALAISLAVVVVFALLSQATAEEKRPRKSAPLTSYSFSGPEGGKPGKSLKAKTGQKNKDRIENFQIQHATSDLQNAESVRSQKKKGLKSK